MANFHDRTAAPVCQRGLLRAGGRPCDVLSSTEVVALTADRPARPRDALGRFARPALPSADALLAERAELPPDPLIAPATAARTLHLRRQLAQAAEHGAALLAALGLPRLVTPDFAPLDGTALGEAVELVLASLDDLDDDADLEDGSDAEHDTADAELPLGWSAQHSQAILGNNTDDGDLTALERHGRGFVRSGPDDAEETCQDEDCRDPWPAPRADRSGVAHV